MQEAKAYLARATLNYDSVGSGGDLLVRPSKVTMAREGEYTTATISLPLRRLHFAATPGERRPAPEGGPAGVATGLRVDSPEGRRSEGPFCTQRRHPRQRMLIGVRMPVSAGTMSMSKSAARSSCAGCSINDAM